MNTLYIDKQSVCLYALLCCRNTCTCNQSAIMSIICPAIHIGKIYPGIINIVIVIIDNIWLFFKHKLKLDSFMALDLTECVSS